MVESVDEAQRQIQRAGEHLIDAVFDNNTNLIVQITSAGFPVNNPLNKQGQTIMHIAVQIERTQVVSLLLNEMRDKLDINAQDISGRTVLHYACRQGNLELLKAILAFKGVNTEARTRGGETPLMHACQSGQLFVVGECLNNNFNPFQKNGLMQTARDQANMFQNVYGHDLRAILDTAITQWQGQVTKEQIDAITQDPEKIFHNFVPHVNVNAQQRN